MITLIIKDNFVVGYIHFKERAKMADAISTLYTITSCQYHTMQSKDIMMHHDFDVIHYKQYFRIVGTTYRISERLTKQLMNLDNPIR